MKRDIFKAAHIEPVQVSNRRLQFIEAQGRDFHGIPTRPHAMPLIRRPLLMLQAVLVTPLVAQWRRRFGRARDQFRHHCRRPR